MEVSTPLAPSPAPAVQPALAPINLEVLSASWKCQPLWRICLVKGGWACSGSERKAVRERDFLGNGKAVSDVNLFQLHRAVHELVTKVRPLPGVPWYGAATEAAQDLLRLGRSGVASPRSHKGCVARWDDVKTASAPARPRMLMALSVETEKPRLIHDARPLNRFILRKPFHTDPTGRVAYVGSQGCYMTSLDDCSAFHYLLIRP